MTRDEKIDEMYDMMLEDHTLTHQTHAAVFGNGKPGLKAEMERIKGVLIFAVPALAITITAVGVFVAWSN